MRIHHPDGGKTVYFAGDTGLFGDMRLLGELYSPDIAVIPIGDNFTMGPDDALVAARMISAKVVIPCHYNTFPVIETDPYAFVMRLGEKGLEGRVIGFDSTESF